MHTFINSSRSWCGVVSESFATPPGRYDEPMYRASTAASFASMAGMWFARNSEQNAPPWPSQTPKRLHAGRPVTGQLTNILDTPTQGL
jgi:hypothetical protein